MKKLIVSVISTVMMIGAGVAFKSNQDVSVPTVEKSSKETTSVEKKKSKVSKHEDVDKEVSKTDEIQVKEENTTNKSDSKKESVSSDTKKQDAQSNDTSKSNVKSDTKSLILAITILLLRMIQYNKPPQKRKLLLNQRLHQKQYNQFMHAQEVLIKMFPVM